MQLPLPIGRHVKSNISTLGSHGLQMSSPIMQGQIAPVDTPLRYIISSICKWCISFGGLRVDRRTSQAWPAQISGTFQA